MKHVDHRRLVTLDEAGLNLAMGRSHAWVQRGEEYVEPRPRNWIVARGATVRFLPPYSPDLNPIEPAWSLVKKRVRTHAPRTATALRRVARAARHAVQPHHCSAWFRHAGYVNSSAVRD